MAPYAPEQVELAMLNATIEETGFCLCCVRFTCDRMEREFKIPNAAETGRIKELAISVEGGQTYLIVKFLEPPDRATVCELEHALTWPRTASRSWLEDGGVLMEQGSEM